MANRPTRPSSCLLALVMLGLVCFRAPAIDRRPLDTSRDGVWAARGIAYGPYRDGQAPGAAEPTRDQVREDLRLLAGRFDLIRMYGVSEATEHALAVIREERLPLRVMLGAWIAAEEQLDVERRPLAPIPGAREANREQVAGVIRLAKAYPELVWAVNVGNETQVFWTAHPVRAEVLAGYLREVRAAAACPVTTCDDYNFWNKPESRAVADEADFIGLHAYAMWNSQTLPGALAWTRAQVAAVAAMHPGVPIVHAETGWATSVASHGEQARLIIGEPGEPQQELFFRAYLSWACEVELPHFYFEAFDENWKGGDDPAEVEKHWGLWRADRSPKMAVDAERPASDD